MNTKSMAPALFDGAIFRRAVADSFYKLNPRALSRNPVIFVTEVVAALVTVFWLRDLITSNGTAWFSDRPVGASALLRRNLLIYGLGGLIVPFIGIKVIDLIVAALHLA